MKIPWNKPGSPWTHGYMCDICKKEADLEAHNMLWYQVAPRGTDICSPECLLILANMEKDERCSKMTM